MRELSAGERRNPRYLGHPSEDPAALDPTHAAPKVPGGFGGAPPWYEVPPGGLLRADIDHPLGPRFLPGVPDFKFPVSPFDHVVRGHAAVYDAGVPRGNTGFGGSQSYGAEGLSEDTKTALTGLFFLGAVGLAFLAYKK